MLTNTNAEEQNYLDLLRDIITNGDFRQTRNAKTWSTFGKTLEFDLANGFPLLTTKKIFFRGVFEELIFFLNGNTDTSELMSRGIKIWEPNTCREFLDANGFVDRDVYDMGPMYGFQLRHFNAEYSGAKSDYTSKGIDQLAYCMNLLRTDPYNRRIVMTTLNPEQVREGVLWPCHGICIMFNVDKSHRLSCMMTQRSVDVACGLPFNIASYALLVHLICEVINNDPDYTGAKFTPGRLIMNLGDTHIYEDHKEGIDEQISRTPRAFPKLKINCKVRDFTDFKFQDIELCDYNPDSTIKFKMIA